MAGIRRSYPVRGDCPEELNPRQVVLHTDQVTRQRPRLYYGWVIVTVVVVTGIAQSVESHPVLGVFLKPMTEEFGWSRTVFTGAVTIGTVLGGALAIVVGPLLDRYGTRWILVISLSILGGLLILMAGVNTLWQFYTVQILARIVNMGIIVLAIQVVIPKWFIAKRGRAVAVSGLGVMLGNAITPIYVQLLINIAGWREAALTAGVVIWVVSVLPAAIFLRRSPEDMGLLPDGASPENVDESPALAPTHPARQSRAQERSLSLRQVVRLPSFYLLVTSFGLIFFVGPGLFFHTIPYLTDQGLGSGVAVATVAVTAIGAGLGSLVFGLLAERYSTRLILTGDFLLMAIAPILLLAVASPAAALLWGLFLGVVQGGMFTVQQVILADYYGRGSLGAVRGIVWPVQMWANAAGPLSASLAYDATGDYVFIFGLFGILSLVSSLCVFLARPPSFVAPTGLDPSEGNETRVSNQ